MKQNSKEEKLEFLKRREIRTMQKDIARLREKEAQEERERIAALKPEEKRGKETQKEKERIATLKPEEKREEKEVQVISPIKKEVLDTLIPEPPKRPPHFQKILARGIVVVIIFFILGFFYWFLAIKKAEVPSEGELPSGEEIEEEVAEETEIIIPFSLISASTTETLAITTLEEIPQALAQFLEKDLETDVFTRVLIKDSRKNEILGLKEFFEAFEIKTPQGFLEKINNDFTLFVYSTQDTNHLGFISKVEKGEGLLNLFEVWEKTMEKDTENLFSLLGKEGPALAPYFRTFSYKEVSFRFLTISKADFGICYAWFNNYFVLTSSFESMEKAIEGIKTEGIKANKAEEKIGQLFIIGFEGKTLTPQLEEMFKKYRPGGVLLLAKNIGNEEQLKNLTKDLQALSLRETGLPLFIAVDQEGGIISRIEFSQEKTAQSEIENTEQAFQIGQARGKELKELGINLNLAPVLDIVSQEDFLHRTFKKNPTETGELAKSLILGQKEAGILTAIKHFPGYDGVTFSPEEKLAERETLPEISQFKKAAEANPELVMTANLIYKNLDPSLPFTFSSEAIQFLKNNLGSEILIISDDLAQDYLLEKFSLKEIVTKPVQAGLDLLIFSGWEIGVTEGLDVFFEAFRKGEISQVKVNSAVSKIIQLKQNLIE